MRRLGPAIVLLGGGALIAALAPLDGGFFPHTTGFAALTVLAVLAVRIVAARGPWAGRSRGLVAAATLLAGHGAWTLASGVWSDAPARALLEADRTLLYLAVLVLFGLLGRTEGRARLLLGGVAIATVGLCLAATATWLLPETFPLGPGFDPRRLGWPTSYWNATGLLAALAIVFAARLSSAAYEPALVRIAGAAALPVCSATLVFSVSRGGALAALCGVAVVVVMGWSSAMPGALLAGVPAAAAGILLALGIDGLNVADPPPRVLDEARDLALALALITLGTAMLRAALLPLDRRLAAYVPTPRARRGALAGAAIAGVLALGAGAVAGGAERLGDAVSELGSSAEVPADLPAEQRFTQLGTNGRLEHWRVALDAGFEPSPMHGSGAGTYALLWARERDTPLTVLDAHSLWIEVLAELGLVGLVLVAALIALLLAALARRALSFRAGAWTGLLAGATAWLVHASIDWHWEMPGVTAWVFAAGGLALAAPLAVASVDPGVPGRVTRRGSVLPRVAAVLLLASLAILPGLVVRSQLRLDAAIADLRRGDCAGATQAALDARSALRSRPEPYEILAYCQAAGGQAKTALALVMAAQRRDPDSWELHYAEALVRAFGGTDPRRALRAALRRNPREQLTRESDRFLARADRPGEWRRWAKTAPQPLSVTPGCGRPCAATPRPR